MLRRILINNYKLFENFDLELDEGINLVCGPNGSGKSALLDLLYALTRFLAMPHFSEHVSFSVEEAFPFGVFRRWISQESGYGDMEVKVEIDDTGGGVFFYDLTIRYNFLERKNRVEKEVLTYKGKEVIEFLEGSISMFTDDKRQLAFKSDWNTSGVVIGSPNNSIVRRFGEMVSRIIPLHIVPFAMRQDFTHGSRALGKLGENFPAWRFDRIISQSEKQNWVIEQCKNFIPGLVSINNPKSGDIYRLAVRVNFEGKNHDLHFQELSDGQKVLMALYYILANIPDRSTLILDEPENFLAPGELQPWLDAMHDAWEERDIQFIVISHNPKTLNWFHNEAFIFHVGGEPPRVVCNKYGEGKEGLTLFNKLCEMEWAANEAGF